MSLIRTTAKLVNNRVRTSGTCIHTYYRPFSISTSVYALEPKKPSIQAIGELRKRLPGTSMLKAREALLSSRSSQSPDQDDINAALSWLHNDLARTGAKKAAKVANRAAREGLLAVAILSDHAPPHLSPQAAIVEVNCETDFVARNQVFSQLVCDIAHTAAMLPTLISSSSSSSTGIVDIELEKLLCCPLLASNPETATTTATATATATSPNHPIKSVADSITDIVARLGERISVARAAVVHAPTDRSSDNVIHIPSAFAHGGTSSSSPNSQPGYLMSTGRVASLLLTRFSAKSKITIPESARPLVRSLARQTAGMTTRTIQDSHSSLTSEAGGEEKGETQVSEALYTQPFIMLLPSAAPTPESSTLPVYQVLDQYSSANQLNLQVTHMKRWELGETAEAQPQVDPDAFANQVRKAAGLA